MELDLVSLKVQASRPGEQTWPPERRMETSTDIWRKDVNYTTVCISIWAPQKSAPPLLIAVGQEFDLHVRMESQSESACKDWLSSSSALWEAGPLRLMHPRVCWHPGFQPGVRLMWMKSQQLPLWVSGVHQPCVPASATISVSTRSWLRFHQTGTLNDPVPRPGPAPSTQHQPSLNHPVAVCGAHLDPQQREEDGHSAAPEGLMG